MRKKEVSEKKVTAISIPTSLYKRVEKQIKETGFTSVSNYIIYVLRNLLEEEEKSEESLTEKDEEKIKARLRALGYID